MHIRQFVMAALAFAPLGGATQTVVDLPGVHASAETACVETTDGARAALSYACLNRAMAATQDGGHFGLGTPVGGRPTNTLGLYNASSLSHRMGQNLGISVEPFRPKTSYPKPLAH